MRTVLLLAALAVSGCASVNLGGLPIPSVNLGANLTPDGLKPTGSVSVGL